MHVSKNVEIILYLFFCVPFRQPSSDRELYGDREHAERKSHLKT